MKIAWGSYWEGGWDHGRDIRQGRIERTSKGKRRRGGLIKATTRGRGDLGAATVLWGEASVALHRGPEKEVRGAAFKGGLNRKRKNQASKKIGGPGLETIDAEEGRRGVRIPGPPRNTGDGEGKRKRTKKRREERERRD